MELEHIVVDGCEECDGEVVVEGTRVRCTKCGYEAVLPSPGEAQRGAGCAGLPSRELLEQLIAGLVAA